MALRLSGQILLGASRIYFRKARYLLDDCNETLDRLKLNFKTDAQVDLPQEQARAPLASITLASNFSTTTAANLLLPEPELDLDEILNMVATQPAGQAVAASANNNNLKEKFNLGKATSASATNNSLLEAFPMSEDFEIETGRRLSSLSGMNMSRDTNPFINRDSPAAFKLEDTSAIEMGRRESLASAAMSPMRLASASTPAGKDSLAGMPMMMDDNDLMWDSPMMAGPDGSPLADAPFNTPPKPAKSAGAAAGKKRKVALDEVTELSSSQIQKQVKDTSDILLATHGNATNGKSSKRGKSAAMQDAALLTEETRRLSLTSAAAVNENDAAALLARPAFEGDLIMDTFGDLFRNNPLSQMRKEAESATAVAANESSMNARDSLLPNEENNFMPVDDGFDNLEAPMMIAPFNETGASFTASASAPLSMDISSALEASDKGIVSLQTIISGQSRSTAAKAFFDVLAGAACGQWKVAQSMPYGEISLSSA